MECMQACQVDNSCLALMPLGQHILAQWMLRRWRGGRRELFLLRFIHTEHVQPKALSISSFSIIPLDNRLQKMGSIITHKICG